MIISHARPHDLAGIVALEQVAFDAGEQWSETAWADELAGHDRYVLARFDVDDSIIGVATFSRVAEMSDLNRVIVHPDFRGRGIGASSSAPASTGPAPSAPGGCCWRCGPTTSLPSRSIGASASLPSPPGATTTVPATTPS